MGFGIHSQVRVKSLKVGSRSKQEMGVAFKSEKQSVWALVFKVEKNRKWVWFPRQEKTRNG